MLHICLVYLNEIADVSTVVCTQTCIGPKLVIPSHLLTWHEDKTIGTL